MEEMVISVDMRLAKSGLSVRAYQKLKVLILDQAIPPGARLGIDVLAAQLGISQTPVREALARLEGDGLVLRNTAGRYHAAPQLNLEAFDQLYTVRILLEPFCAGAAARSITAPELAKLRSYARVLAGAGTRGRSEEFAGYIAADSGFHETIAAASQNSLLYDAVHHLHVHHRLGPLFRVRGVTDAAVAIREHEGIVAAIAAHEASRAETLMREHIERSRDQLRPWVETDARSADRSATGQGLK
jgi:DNA-binding GntR family transcriptional regulator